MRLLCLVFLICSVIKTSGQESGQPPLVPYWAFGHWVWEDAEHKQDTVKYLIDTYRKHGIRVSAVILDSPWSTCYNDFEFDTALYPNPKELIDYIHSNGARALAFYTGAINRTSSDSRIGKCSTYDFVVENNYMINNGEESSWWKGYAVHIDFTNPEATAWWHTQLDKMYDLGIDGAKIDIAYASFGDTLLTSKGIMHVDDFGYHYFADGFDYGLRRNKDFVSLTYGYRRNANISNREDIVRGRCYGPITKCHVNWVGDFRGDWKGIRMQLEDIYKSANHGYVAPGCEIGGYFRPASNKKQFIRYTQLASLVPAMINGGSFGALDHHLPWKHDEQTVCIYKKFVDLHYRISPYLFSTSVDCHYNPASILKDCNFQEESHKLGKDIFVQTITSGNDTCNITFPEEHYWIDYWSNEDFYSPSEEILKHYPIERYPVFIRAGSIIPTKEDDDLISFEIYPHKQSQYLFHRPAGDGVGYEDIRVNIDEETGELTIDSKTVNNFAFNIVCFKRPGNVTGADDWEYDADTKTLSIKVEGKKEKIKIEGLVGYASQKLGITGKD